MTEPTREPGHASQPAAQEQQPAYDDQWYERFQELGGLQVYEYLVDEDAGRRANERSRFEAGEVQNPVLENTKINPEQLDQQEELLLQLKEDILSNERNEVVAQVYRWRINEQIARLRMLRAAHEKDTRAFHRYSRFVYGKPSKEIFQYTVGLMHNRIEAGLASDNPQIREAAERTLALSPKKPETIHIERPGAETVQLAQEATLKELGDLIQIPEEMMGQEKLDAQQIAAMFENALLKLKADGWKVSIDTSSKSTISVDQEHRVVRVPQARTVASDYLQRLIAHEIGTHVNQRISGERSRLRLLGLGLDRSEQGEEGVATMREQAIQGSVADFSGWDGHLSISLAMGLDENPRDFRQTYDVLYSYAYLKQLQSGAEPAKADEAAKNYAWNTAVRTFRGTDGSAGTPFTKDIIYREGNIAVWHMLQTDQNRINHLSIGKIDPTNDRHIWVLEQLGLMDQDLTALEQSQQE